MNREDGYLSDDEMALEKEAREELEGQKDFLRALRRIPNIQEILDRAELPGTGTPNARFTRFGELVEEAAEVFKTNSRGMFLDEINVQYIGNSAHLTIDMLSFSCDDMKDFKRVSDFISNFDGMGISDNDGTVAFSFVMRDILDDDK